MSATNTIKVRCPGCRAKYLISAEVTGKKLRCKKCDQVFRVASPAGSRGNAEPSDSHREDAGKRARLGYPTEDDICRWLMEGLDEDVPLRPRIANAPPSFSDGNGTSQHSKPSPRPADQTDGAGRGTPGLAGHQGSTSRKTEASTRTHGTVPSSGRSAQDYQGPRREPVSLRKTA